MKRVGMGGYTITEVMIVLAVTGGMFVLTAALLNGRQARTEFTQGVQEYASKMQSMINEVASGYYQNGFTCTAPASGGPPVPTTTTATPGGNKDCVFLGKAMIQTATDPYILTAVGRHYKAGSLTDDVTTVQEALPKEVANAREDYALKFGVSITNVRRIDGLSNLTGFAYYFELGASDAGGAISGSRSVRLYGLTGSVDNVASSNYVTLPKGLVVCLLGANGQRAEVTLGGNGSDTGISTKIDSGTGQCG